LKHHNANEQDIGRIDWRSLSFLQEVNTMTGSLLQIPLSREALVTSEITFRLFQHGDADAFRELNESWIAQYFRLEEQDHIQLRDPEGSILRTGGQIVMAVAGEERIGCCALIFIRSGVFEVAKMAVSERYRGHGIGRKLLECTIKQAKALGARTLELASNTKLANAVHLYESLGFRHLPPDRVEPSPYARANVFMELHLSSDAGLQA
jgi:N-acetylglutamate synthase-like GNAT family acetyltransferase